MSPEEEEAEDSVQALAGVSWAPGNQPAGIWQGIGSGNSGRGCFAWRMSARGSPDQNADACVPRSLSLRLSAEFGAHCEYSKRRGDDESKLQCLEMWWIDIMEIVVNVVL